MVVTLIGYRGSGKSTVAALLAHQLGWDWSDSDVEIERTAGRTISEIFAIEGEAAFRRLEREVIAKQLTSRRLVLAVGGGAILDEQNRQRLKAAGPVVWLQASVKSLKQRIIEDQTTDRRRPQLTDQGVTEEIEAVLTAREPLYRQSASITIKTDNLSPEETTHRVLHTLVTDVFRMD